MNHLTPDSHYYPDSTTSHDIINDLTHAQSGHESSGHHSQIQHGLECQFSGLEPSSLDTSGLHDSFQSQSHISNASHQSWQGAATTPISPDHSPLNSSVSAQNWQGAATTAISPDHSSLSRDHDDLKFGAYKSTDGTWIYEDGSRRDDHSNIIEYKATPGGAG